MFYRIFRKIFKMKHPLDDQIEAGDRRIEAMLKQFSKEPRLVSIETDEPK